MTILLRRLAVLLALVAFCVPAVAGDELPEPHDEEIVKKALERFKQDYDGDDLDKRIHILRWFGRHRHKIALKQLRKIFLKEKDLELVAAAAEGLGHQLHDPKGAGKVLLQGIDKHKTLANWTPETPEDRVKIAIEESVLVNAIQAMQHVGFHPDWKKIKKLIDHNSDGVAIAIIKLCEVRKEYKALPVIYEWFEHYPDGVSWSGGSVRVDTGAAGNKDAKAAKAKWKAKYGGRAKKARPNAFLAMVECVKVLTGEEINKRDELKEWMEENKVFLRKHGV